MEILNALDEMDEIADLLRSQEAVVSAHRCKRTIIITTLGGKWCLERTSRGWRNRNGLLPARSADEVANHTMTVLRIRRPSHG